MVPECTVGWTQAGGSSVMLWVMFSWDTLAPIIPIAKSLAAIRYLNIVADQLCTHSMQLCSLLMIAISYQQDVSCHTARIVKEWLEEYELSINFQGVV